MGVKQSGLQQGNFFHCAQGERKPHCASAQPSKIPRDGPKLAVRLCPGDKSSRNADNSGCLGPWRGTAANKPFSYRVEEKIAILDVPAPAGMGANYGWRYEISIGK